MNIFKLLRETTGLDSVQTHDGYTQNLRAGQMPVCDRCGALVTYETQPTHTEWHKQTRA